MKNHDEPKRDEPLHQLLQEWTVESTLPPGFQNRVWRRLDGAQAARPQPTFRAWLERLIVTVVPRPKFAYVYLAVLLTAGIAGGSFAAQMKASQLDSELRLRYVQTIDPFQAGLPQP